MKKGKTLYLVAAILLFIILLTPYFESFVTPVMIQFFGSQRMFTGLYLWLITFGMIEGALITLYIQSLLKDIKSQEVKKFDLS